MLEQYLRERRAERDVLLMTHIVIGYPDLDTSLKNVEAMVENGVDVMELQVPFSEPIADGPVILHLERVNSQFDFGNIYLFRFDDAGNLESIGRAENSGIDESDNWILERADAAAARTAGSAAGCRSRTAS